MRITSLITIGILTFAPHVHACEDLFGRLLKPEDLRPNMIVQVHQTAPVLEEHEVADTLEPDLDLDTYLEWVGVRGDIVISAVHFTAVNTVDIELFPLEDIEMTSEGHMEARHDQEPKRLTYAYKMSGGTGESPKFRVIGHVERHGRVFTRVVLVNSKDV